MAGTPEDDQTSPKGTPHTGLLDSRIDEALARREQTGGGGGGSGGGTGLDARVAKLEAHTEHMQLDLTEIRNSLGAVASQLRHLPTKQDMTNNVMTMVVIGLTVLVLGVGGIIGGLAWIQDRDAPAAKEPVAPAPMIFQLPAPQQIAPQGAAPVAPTPAPVPPKK